LFLSHGACLDPHLGVVYDGVFLQTSFDVRLADLLFMYAYTYMYIYEHNCTYIRIYRRLHIFSYVYIHIYPSWCYSTM
jgi:hypothetical protein